MIKIISCAIFKPYIEQLALDKKFYQIVYLDIQQHNQQKQLSKSIQYEIEITKNVSNIIILYGLCGGALLSIYTKKTPLTIVRVHDCLAILLGSKKRYREITHSNPSLQWSCYSLQKSNYLNDCISQWSEQYDEETVQYLRETLCMNKPLYVSHSLDAEKRYVDEASEVIEGDLSFLESIVKMNALDVITLLPNKKLKQTLDDDVLTVENI